MILIGGKALVELGSSRSTTDTDYLVNDLSSKSPFIHDVENNIDYINANGHKLFSEIFKLEDGNKIASAQSILELKAYSFVQHCLNHNWQKVDDAEYDIKFLCRKFNLKGIKIANKYMTAGELLEVKKIIDSVK